MFGPMKEELSNRRYHSDDDMKATTQEWLSGIAWDFHAEGIKKLVPPLDECLNTGCNCVEK